jgi:hypothetical protein
LFKAFTETLFPAMLFCRFTIRAPAVLWLAFWHPIIAGFQDGFLFLC